MNEREFIKLVRELHLLQLKVLGEEHLLRYVLVELNLLLMLVSF